LVISISDTGSLIEQASETLAILWIDMAITPKDCAECLTLWAIAYGVEM
jgi:hypothetical protein